LELSLEDLLDIEVTSVSKKAQSLSDTAAAIFVITNDDLRRSGVTNIPDALRMVPGLNVARIDSNKWAVTSRGFNGRFANKLLVLIDGRSIYTPTFSGVYWEVQDVSLEDVQRIEVIRGPGATLWGANAVNGVINIITRHTADTQDCLLTLGSGTEERGFGSVRYGTTLGEGTYGRIYARGFKRDESVLTTGGDAGDGWNILQSGFRADSRLSGRDALTLQGDIYKSDINQTMELPELTDPYSQIIEDKADDSGWNLVTRWQHTLSPTSEFALQTYYDRIDRKEAIKIEVRDTFDIDFQHRFAAGELHDIIWGLGYRNTHDDFKLSCVGGVYPYSRSDDLFSAFVQDEITIVEDLLWLTVGSKFEHNYHTGFEIQPNARLFWAAHPRHKLWAAVSRSVRTPARVEDDIRMFTSSLPPHSHDNPSRFMVAIMLTGDHDYESEELMAYELGYRVAPIRNLSFDLTVFYNDYDRLRSGVLDRPVPQGPYIEQPLRFDNEIKNHSYGFELASVWQAAYWWRWDLAYSYLRSDFDVRIELDKEVNSDGPKHQVSLRSVMNIKKELDLDLWLRYVDDVKAVNITALSRTEIESYLTLDARLAWRVRRNIELSLVGQNLLDAKHPEYVHEFYAIPTQIERSMYGKITWHF